MFLAEPPRTQFDLSFSLFKIPVRVSPWFWLMGVILGASGFQTAKDLNINGGILVVIWIGAIFISILVHEFGHALTMRRFGESPRVVLYMMGGLAIADSGFSGRGRNSRQQIIISAMGPIAGFLLAGLVIGLVYAFGGAVVFEFDSFIPWNVELERGIPFVLRPGIESNHIYLHRLINAMLFVNIFWGLMNLLPVYPLDGGQISREIFVGKDPWKGLVKSLWVSVYTGAIVAGLAIFVLNSFFMGIMFGMLAFGSYQVLQQISGRGGGYGGGGQGGYGGGGRPW